MEAQGRARHVTVLEARDLWVAPPGAPAAGRRNGTGPSGPGSDGCVVRGVSLALGAGEWVAVTGPNGGGKSSLLLALAGLWPAARGEVRVGGDALGPGAPRDVRARVATVLQDPSAQILQPTVAEEIGFAARNLGLPAATVEAGTRRWIERFGLVQVAGQDPSRLPAGRQQLVLLASALAAGPRVLVADEPGCHWDSRHRALALEALEEERRRGLAILWATQDRREMEQADRVIQIGAEGMPPGGVEAPWAAGTGREPVLELRIDPWAGGPGPHLETSSGFDLEIPSGTVTSVTGPNGAGKSVLLAAAAGAEPIPQVRARWRGTPADPPILVTQYPEMLFFEELVRDELAYAAGARGLGREEILRRSSACFEALGLQGADLQSRRMWELSGGTRRLVEVVAALIAPAGLVVLDEPTAGLDGTRRRGLARLVRRRSSGSAVLVASQDREWLEWIGGRSTELGRATPSSSKKTD